MTAQLNPKSKAAREIIVLNVNENESGFHDVLRLKVNEFYLVTLLKLGLPKTERFRVQPSR